MTTNQRSREAAYADLVSGLIDARVDVASDRFDAELEAAEASGRLDPATARLLRWWQRESVRAVTEHARTTVPVTLVALEKAEKEALEAVYRAEAAWTTARGVSARAAYANEPSVPAPPVAANEPVVEETVAAPTPSAIPAEPVAAPDAVAEPAAPVFQAPEPAPWSATVTPSASPAGPTLEPPNYPGGTPTASAEREQNEPPYPTTPGEAPGIVDLTAHEQNPDEGATPASGRRRTLLAGLTVLPRSD